MNDIYLDKMVKCPGCYKDIRDGDRIWLDGVALCPECYEKRKEVNYDRRNNF